MAVGDNRDSGTHKCLREILGRGLRGRSQRGLEGTLLGEGLEGSKGKATGGKRKGIPVMYVVPGSASAGSGGTRKPARGLG